jgi:hypothetical protein
MVVPFEVVVYTLPALWNQLAVLHAEVRVRVNQEPLLSGLVDDEEAVGGVVQTFAATDDCCVSFPAGWGCWAGNSFAPGFEALVVPAGF